MKTGASFNRATSCQSHATPPEFIKAVERRFQRKLSFDLAASEENKKAEKFFSKEDDSLNQSGQIPGLLWLNPPFADIVPWADKCARESKDSTIQIIMLTPASVGSNWFSQFVHKKAQVLFLNGRITFVGSKDPYPKDCMLSLFGFGESGFDIWRWKS